MVPLKQQQEHVNNCQCVAWHEAAPLLSSLGTLYKKKFQKSFAPRAKQIETSILNLQVIQSKFTGNR